MVLALITTTIIAASAPVITGVPTISGTAQEGQTLTATPASVTGEPTPTRTWQWLRDGAPISGATSITYALVSADVGAAISVRQTETNASGTDTATTAETAAVTANAVAPSITGVPTISGTAQENQTLTASPASVTGTPTPTRSWQWKSNGTNVGTDSTTYAVLASDVGNTITVTQTETNASGSDSATSTATATVTAAPTGEGSISSISASDQQAGGGVDLIYVVTESVNVDAVLTTSATKPTAAQVSAGLDHTGSAASGDWQNLVWTTAGSDVLITFPDELGPDTFYFHAVQQGGADNEVVSSNGFALDTTAPVVTSIVTNNSGDLITITINKSAYGELNTANFTLNGASGTQSIQTATTLDNTIELQLGGNPIIGSDTPTLDYTPGSITDRYSNNLAAFTGMAITNNVPAVYSETLVTANLKSALRAPSPLPSGTTSLLFMFSGITLDGGTGRKCFVNWNGGGNGIYATYNSSSGNGGLWVDMDADGLTAAVDMNTIPHGTRYHALMHIRVKSDGDLELIGSTRTAGGAWSDAWTDILVSGSATSLDLVDTVEMKLLELIGAGGLVDGNDQAGHDWRGDIARLAMWSATDNSLIADPGSPTVQANFVNGSDQTVDPATARAAYGTPAFDFNGPVRLWNFGLHYGSLANFASTENFS